MGPWWRCHHARGRSFLAFARCTRRAAWRGRRWRRQSSCPAKGRRAPMSADAYVPRLPTPRQLTGVDGRRGARGLLLPELVHTQRHTTTNVVAQRLRLTPEQEPADVAASAERLRHSLGCSRRLRGRGHAGHGRAAACRLRRTRPGADAAHGRWRLPAGALPEVDIAVAEAAAKLVPRKATGTAGLTSGSHETDNGCGEVKRSLPGKHGRGR